MNYRESGARSHLLIVGHVHLRDPAGYGEAGQLVSADVSQQDSPQTVHITQHLLPPEAVEGEVGGGEDGEGSSLLQGGGQVRQLQGLDQDGELGLGPQEGHDVGVAVQRLT